MERGHAICDYEGTSYRVRFWEGQGREYEDLAERIAIRGLLPPRGGRLLELGAGFGRLADLYQGYDQVILLDYAVSGLREAQERLGASGRYLFVAADLYNLPLAPGTCDVVVTVRVLHHVVDIPAALREIARVLRANGVYLLEYANKRHLKAVARYLLRLQGWSPFALEPFEFAHLNFDFHPRWMAEQLQRAGFMVEAGRAVSHFRHPFFKRLIPPKLLAAVDGLIQAPSAAWKLSPSVFLRARGGKGSPGDLQVLFWCPICHGTALRPVPDALECEVCGAAWSTAGGIYNFKSPMATGGH